MAAEKSEDLVHGLVQKVVAAVTSHDEKAAGAEAAAPGMADKLKEAQEIAQSAVGDVKGAASKIGALFGRK